MKFSSQNMSFESEEKIKWTLDGEFGGDNNRVNIEVIPNAVDIII